MVNIDSDDFALLDLPRRFDLDRDAIDARWRALQAEVHPDRFVAQGAAAQRIASQWAVRINEAHRRLRDPLRRAAYLCELAGAPIEAESNTAMPVEFLQHQLGWRESLEEAGSPAELQALAAEVAAYRLQALAQLVRSIDEQADHAGAARQVRALMFVERFAADLEQRLRSLGQ